MFGKNKKEKDPNKVGFWRLSLWNSTGVSMATVTLVSAYLMIYCTDTLGIPAAIVSTVMVVSKVFDAFTDMVAGIIVDRTETRWGRGRPYEIFVSLTWLMTWLMFTSSPEFSMPVKVAWLFFTYTTSNAVCQTFMNASGLPRMIRTFNNKSQYITLSSFATVYIMIFAVMFNIGAPILISKFATSASGWSTMIAFIAIPMAIIGSLRMILMPEVNKEDVKTTKEEDKVKLKDVFKLFKTNKFFLIILLASSIYNMISNMGVTVYYFTYIVKNLALQGTIGMISIIVIPAAFMLPSILKHVSVTNLIKYGLFTAAIGYVINFFAGGNVAILMLGGIFTSLGTIPISMFLSLLLIDNADYNEYQGNQRMEATMGGVLGLASKIGNAVGVGLLGALLSLSGYTGVMETMPDGSFMMIRLLFSLIPFAFYLFVGIMFNFYKLDQQIPEIKAALETKKRTTE